VEDTGASWIVISNTVFFFTLSKPSSNQWRNLVLILELCFIVFVRRLLSSSDNTLPIVTFKFSVKFVVMGRGVVVFCQNEDEYKFNNYV